MKVYNINIVHNQETTVEIVVKGKKFLSLVARQDLNDKQIKQRVGQALSRRNKCGFASVIAA